MSEDDIKRFLEAAQVYARLYKSFYRSFRIGNIPANFCHLAALGMTCQLMPGEGPAKPGTDIPDSVQEFLNAMILKKENPDDDPR